MADIKSIFIDMGHGVDMALVDGLLAEDDGLDTAIILSLFTDRRAEKSDTLPLGATDRRGWWADAFSTPIGDKIGSRLWLTWPGKQTAENLRNAELFAEEALAWLVTDGIAASVAVSGSNPRDGLLALSVQIVKPSGDTLNYQIDSLWSAVA
ncbi:phage GP46 family protein [Denitratisoma sp. agr-D3]